ncbi:glycosyltransferase [Nostoc sp.]|uniref:glycosyltransferase n=1 Tax=Nostoc sp. TaxID=1180 RepID=UPI002FF46A16
MKKKLTESNISECQAKFNLSYHVNFAHWCEQLVGFADKDVLEVGGSLPQEFVFNYLNTKTWTALESLEYDNSLKGVSDCSLASSLPKMTDISNLEFNNQKLDNYTFFAANIEDLPLEHYNQYDLIFSIAAFEHIHKIPSALEKMFLALKPGGQVFTVFSPIWSAHDGHHLPLITEVNQKRTFHFHNSPIPPWGHLFMKTAELCHYLYQFTNKETADLMTYYVYNSPHINRFFTEDYVEFINQSSFKIKRLDSIGLIPIPEEIQKKLETLYPGRNQFANNGILAVLEKPQDDLSQQTLSKMESSGLSQVDFSDLDSSRKDGASVELTRKFQENDTQTVQKKALVFFPHNPYPPKTGAHQRCLTILSGIKELGYDVTLFGSNLITDNLWEIDSSRNLQHKLAINVKFYEGTQADRQFMAEVSAGSKGLTSWEFYTPPGLCERFRQLFTEIKPDIIVINYALWAKLAIGDEFKSAVTIIDTIDLITLNGQMREALGKYLNSSPYTSDKIDPQILDEDFFSRLQLDATPEEYWIYDQYDYTIAIALREAQFIQKRTQRTQVEYVPMTFTTEELNNTYCGEPLLAIGPNPFNIQGYLYFATKVLPLVLSQIPEFRLRVVGSSCQHLTPAEGIELLGFVSDLKPLYTESRFAICPLIGGTGQQVKIVEAMAHGVPVITLRNVADSSPIEHGVNGLIANNAEEFAEYIIQLFRNKELCHQLGQASRHTIVTNFNKEKLLENLSFLNPEHLQKSNISIKNPLPKIIIDGVFFQLYQTGIARVWKCLLEEWVINGFTKHIIVFDRAGTAPKIPGVRYRSFPRYDYNNTDADREMLQQMCDEEGADLFISSYYTTPTTTPSVFMAYDMIPEVMGWDTSNPMWRQKHQGIQHASAYIAISDHTARDLVSCFTDISIKSVTVAHCGVQSLFSPAKYEDINTFKAKYGITKPYFILVGGGSGYKNSILFFQAFSKLTNSYGFDIVCTGSGGLLAPEFRANTSGSIVYMLQLTDEELATAYSGAVALVYPSKYEGFGMPVLEAMACGCPVITCPNSSITEVTGDAAIYVQDDDVNALANALCEVQKPSIRHSLITAGLVQAKKFSWTKMAQTVSCALIDATLLSLNINEINLIIFPDWSQPEELVGLELERVMKTVATHIDREKTTLLINTGNIAVEDAELFLSSVVMNLLVQEDLDVTEKLEISLVENLADIQWEALLPRIHARIVLEYEDKNALSQAKAETLTSYEIEIFKEAQAEQFFFA